MRSRRDEGVVQRVGDRSEGDRQRLLQQRKAVL